MYLAGPRLLKKNGIFRLSGNFEKTNKFVKEHTTYKPKRICHNIQSEKYCYEVTDAYKKYLREYPSPIFPEFLNEHLKDIATMERTEVTFEKLRNAIFLLEAENQQILKHTLYISSLVLANTSYNQMDSLCLSRTIGPNLFWIKNITTTTSLNWTTDIYELLLMKDMDYWFIVPSNFQHFV